MTQKEFTDIYLPLGDCIYRVAYHILESEDDAKDVVQDIFVKLLGSLDTLDAVYNPRAYCITLARNMCLDRLRAASGRKVPLVEGLQDKELSPPPDASLEQKEKLRKLASAIFELPPKQRMVLRMKVLEDKSYQEICRESGVGYLTLRVLLSQARRKLRDLI